MSSDDCSHETREIATQQTNTAISSISLFTGQRSTCLQFPRIPLGNLRGSWRCKKYPDFLILFFRDIGYGLGRQNQRVVKGGVGT